MDTQTINTPENLHQAIVKFLDSNYSHEEVKKTYDDARKCVMRFRGYYSSLPTLRACKKDPLDGLQDIMLWCIEANKAVDDIASNLKRQTIDKIISQFKKVRGFANKVLSLVDKKLQNETRAKYEKKRAQELSRIKAEINNKRLLAKQRAHAAAPGIGSPLVVEAQVEAEIVMARGLGLSEETEEEKAVQSYLSKDPAFNGRLSQLHNNELNRVFEEINKLTGDNTPDGELIERYCKLKDIPLQQQCNEVYYSFTGLTDIILGDYSRLYSSIDNVIKTFEGIQVKCSGSEDKVNSSDVKPKGIPHNPVFSKIKAWLWKLYENTLRVAIDAVLEKLWPKT